MSGESSHGEVLVELSNKRSRIGENPPRFHLELIWDRRRNNGAPVPIWGAPGDLAWRERVG